MDAVISDIHGNLEALEVVLDEIRQLGATRVICLGDLIGYGPDSLACFRRSVNWDVVIAGEWDRAIVEHDPAQWNAVINKHIEWLHNQFCLASDSAALFRILRSLRPAFAENGRLFVHGTPQDVREWIFPEDVYQVQKLNRIAEQFDDACICGHSHIPGIFRRTNEWKWEFLQLVENEPYEIKHGQKTIITAGSVGQPRDNDPRTSFLTIDAGCIRFHRVPYDVMRTVSKIHANPEIDNLHGDRLLVGR